ncbi:hypothetical protein ASF22_08105 [Methylobacterium sp. Leaf87]|uniref:BREX system P-loop protein BrxC n=1 Tax=Methylobacterium sp. Leaf87 TaxID=1736243 RepID=UPI0006F5DBD5|nr:BREX system P-loop protein BrxC [Methylobacterium sp. Leaf87]KQO59592.1 hypothetical protein ASF22_08105 [Methylobacterium sp. Leaf87]
MKIKDILVRNPTEALANQGQARIATVDDERTMGELRYELSTFVCEGAFQSALVRMLASYVQNVGRTDAAQKGAWVSGFFGSGKSHLLKMAAHLWQNTQLPGGLSARGAVHDLPSEVADALKELDTASKRAGGLLAAAGTLLGGAMDTPRLTIIGIILRAVRLPDQVPQARFCLWLHDEGKLEAVEASIAATGRTFSKEINNMYVSRPLAKAVLDVIPGFAADEADAIKAFRSQFPAQTGDITTQSFVDLAKRALLKVSPNGKLPCTLVILDEVQQYIGESLERSSNVAECAEALSKEFDGHLMVMGAGQSALNDAPRLQYLLDRFTIRANLQDADVEAVTRKVLLQKKNSAEGHVAGILEKHRGEISRHLSGTQIGERSADHAIIVTDYPLLPVRRRFWEEAFRQVDSAGTSGQLRSQLRIINDALAKMAEADVGKVIPADDLYDALAPDMLASGALLHELNERIGSVGKDHEPLATRVCKIVFLIGKFRREGLADKGIRAKREHIADLLIEDLTVDNGKLRDEVDQVLKALADQSILMPVGDEYRLQTREGAEWDADFRARVAKIRADDALVQSRLNQVLRSRLEAEIARLKLLHGAAKVQRKLNISWGDTPPSNTGNNIPVWVRDGWSASEKEMLDHARKVGMDSPLVHVFIRKQFAEDLRRFLVEEQAARDTLLHRGSPENEEGKEARRGIESREGTARTEKDRIVAELVGQAIVVQGGGAERPEEILVDRMTEAAKASFARLFPRFQEADSPHWDTVIKRVREGSDTPFDPVGHRDTADKHPVAKQVLATVGAGMTGTDIRKRLQDIGFGWPQDAIDAALMALHRSQHISATLNGVVVAVGTLDQNKIPKASFKLEKATLGAADKIRLRELFSKLGVICKSNEEAAKAPDFLSKLLELARAAGGPAPLPEAPLTKDIEDIQRLVGNEQLVALHAKADELEGQVKTWGDLKDFKSQRTPNWTLLERLARHAGMMSSQPEELVEVESIKLTRSLLSTPDPVVPVIKALGAALRAEVVRLSQELATAISQGVAQVEAHPLWSKTDPNERDRLLCIHRLLAPNAPAVGTDTEVLQTLDTTSLRELTDRPMLVPGYVQTLVKELAALHEPKVSFIRIEPSLLRTATEVEDWVDRQRTSLLTAVADGPIQLS